MDPLTLATILLGTGSLGLSAYGMFGKKEKKPKLADIELPSNPYEPEIEKYVKERLNPGYKAEGLSEGQLRALIGAGTRKIDEEAEARGNALTEKANRMRVGPSSFFLKKYDEDIVRDTERKKGDIEAETRAKNAFDALNRTEREKSTALNAAIGSYGGKLQRASGQGAFDMNKYNSDLGLYEGSEAAGGATAGAGLETLLLMLDMLNGKTTGGASSTRRMNPDAYTLNLKKLTSFV